jgi:hypothetical protein
VAAARLFVDRGQDREARVTLGMACSIAVLVTVLLLTFLDKQYLYLVVVFRSAGRIAEAGLWMGALGLLELFSALALAPTLGLPDL